ncbi:MAG: peptide deformylase [Elusimicrobia bacterium]|nr:peptide deformylase [Elusimicrobiota bacterium]MBD3412372.1 peptide deformylase [Elusimicrobiota bacterium]
MSILKIVKFGDRILQQKTHPVDHIDRDIHRLIRNMFQTMYDAPGVGLSANQVGVPLHLFIVDVQQQSQRQPLILMNAQIKSKKGRIVEEEGCLSLPGIFIPVPRWEEVTVTGINEKGMPVEIKATGLLARAFQHELDHLSGKLIVDRTGLVTRLKAKRKIRSLIKEGKWE